MVVLPPHHGAVATDADDDGVDDVLDVCCYTPPGVAVDSEGRPVGDLDLDCDVDLRDYAIAFSEITLARFAGIQTNFTDSRPVDGPCPLTNDGCHNPIDVGEGTTLFTNKDATTDGPNEPSMCNFFGYTHVESDVWFCYTATCTDTVVASLCGSWYDTKLAVYDGCGCPAAEPLACSDDDCGLGVESRVTFAAVATQSYAIRVGGYLGAQGTGVLTVFCGSDPTHGANSCRPGTGDCFLANGTPGCEDADTCSRVCELDQFCCDTEWDDLCAQFADGLVNGFETCAAEAGDCFTANGTPGCERIDCCQAVCEYEPYCCLVDWDFDCASFVPPICGLFPACVQGTGGCFVEHGEPGCDDEPCCNAVCTVDAVCCDEPWDAICVGHAFANCR